MAERCPTCGGAVKSVGETTLHYEPVMQEGMPALLERIVWLERELADCTRDCRKAGARFEQALEVIEFYADPQTYLAIGFFPDPLCGVFMEDFSDAGNGWGQRPGKRAREFMESE